jgi:glutamate synthase domain-containing protein 2
MDYAKPLEEIERLTTTYSESSLSFGVVSKKAAAVLAEANNPGVKE